MLSLLITAAIAAAPAHDICKCGVSCACAESVVVITERAVPTAKICTISERNLAKRSSVPAPRNTATRQTVTTRVPVGHTHTCRNGHTWDHQANPTHTCKICGAFQNVQDQSPRPVTVIRTETIPQTAPRAAPAFVWPVASTSNCANGNCAVPQTFRYR